MALRLTHNEKRAVAEAIGSHYLAGEEDEVGAVSGYGVLVGDLSEEECETRKDLQSAARKLAKELATD